MMAPLRSNPNGGFTLLEIIAAIIISSLLALVIVQIATNNTTRSYLPIANLDHELALQEVMEEIAADYRLLINAHPTPLAEIQSRINARRYWATKPFGSDINVTENYCFDFVINTGTSWQEGPNLGNCQSGGDNLKVTIAYGNTGGHSLTTVFSR